MTDPIADMLTRIRNGQAVKKKTVAVPYSKIKIEIANILVQEGFIESINRVGKKNKKFIELNLKYENNQPRISEITRISKPSQRVYIQAKDVRPVQGGLGILILSTPKGLMTNKEAKKNNIGGEVLLKVF